MDETLKQNYELAEVDYLSNMKYKDIAEKYGVSLNTVKSWKTRHGWSKEKNKGVHTKPQKVRTQRGGQIGNKNATGPPGNKNAEKHGLFSKYLPKDSLDIIELMEEKKPLDLIWDAIQIQYAAIIRSQKIMYVEDKDDMTSTKIGFSKGNTIGETWEVQQAWDKQANFLKAQSRAIDSLKNMVKDYLELEGASKKDTKEQVQDWKMAIIEIARRRSGQGDGRTD